MQNGWRKYSLPLLVNAPAQQELIFQDRGLLVGCETVIAIGVGQYHFLNCSSQCFATHAKEIKEAAQPAGSLWGFCGRGIRKEKKIPITRASCHVRIMYFCKPKFQPD